MNDKQSTERDCEGEPPIEGTIEAFTHLNMQGFGRFEQLGFVRVAMDIWKETWDKELKQFVSTKTGSEEWHKHVKFNTQAELLACQVELAQAGISIVTFRPDPSKLNLLNKSQLAIRR